MNIRKMPKEEIELLSYADIAYEILKNDKKAYTTPDLFKEVCKLLENDFDAAVDMIGDFYTTLTTDKRFTLLDDAKWDLKECHVVKTIVEDEEDEEDAQESDEVEIEGTEDDAVISEDNFDDDASDDDLDDLVIVTEEELEE